MPASPGRSGLKAWPRRSGKTQSRRRDSQSSAPPAEAARSQAIRCFDARRDAAYDVEAASRRWRSAPADDWEAAAWGFFAALDREEKAASEYERACTA